MIEVIALHYHIVEFKERKSLFHSLLIAFRTKHIIYGEACSDITQKVNVVEFEKPIGIVYHNCLVLAELDKSLHLLSEAIAVVLNSLGSHHRTHICSA